MPAATTTSLTTSSLLASATTGAGLAIGNVLFDAIGIPPTVLTMAAIGAITGLLFQRPAGSRWRVFGLAYVYTVISAAGVMLIQQLPVLAWIGSVAPVAALLLAFFAQQLLPIFRDGLVSLVKNRFGGSA
jgi:hypothetical protein